MFSIDNPENVQLFPLLKGAKIIINPREDCVLKTIVCGEDVISVDTRNEYIVTSIKNYNSVDTVRFHYERNGMEIVMYKQFSLKSPQISCEKGESTQTTFTFGKVLFDGDVTTSVKDMYYIVPSLGNRKFHEGDIITGLIPNSGYRTQICIEDSEGEIICDYQVVVNTKGTSPEIVNQNNSPTTVLGSCSYTLIDAHVSETELYFNNTKLEGEGNDFFIHGLDPNKNYTLRYVVKTEEGSTEEYKTTITTPALELATQAVKVPNQGEAIVCATTNIADDETGVGFEWRKTDAPDVVASKSGDAVVFQGSMEGKIKNLDASTYWKARPFYRSTSGNMYYGEWVGFDPSDFSYFEPTVHTYETVLINGTSATLGGCSIEGSDDITEQGFEYWIGTAGARNTYRAQANDIQRVSVDGQRMTATLTGLQTGTTYSYRCYVKTNKGTTYGEVRTFTTSGESDNQSDIANTIVELSFAPSDVYNLRGVKVRSHTTSLDGLPKGLYIVSGKKLFVK